MTTIDRAGSFDHRKIGVLEGRIRNALPDASPQVYGLNVAATGLGGIRVIFPVDITAGQTTTATAIINAYSDATDASLLPRQVRQGLAFLALPSPTLAQTRDALKEVIRYLLQREAGKDKIDGADVS